ncbi:hypothetical protein [Amycolatopsis sp. NBRC 101858]|uniref:hypothetical protein n=1 Tax=Amycolatopsis sp. NBRC 101858 TaxID=3032200 RepID=UPI002555FA9F|nr:hypothetical protein [Amycolatopsis sp. NBRC 101858]
MLEKVVNVLREVTPEPPRHHLGRPYATAYQLAIALDTRYPEVARELGFEIGGADTGRHNSLAQYLGRQLSTRIAREGDMSAIEGAFLSGDHMVALEFVDAHGGHHASSLVDSGFPLTMFRLRPVEGRP